MSRLVLIRVGDPNATWSISKMAGLWASPEFHEQIVRNMFVEGYTVYCIFVGTGDKLLLSAQVTSIRERSDNDTLITASNEIGALKTIIVFDPNQTVDLRYTLPTQYQSVLDYVKYKAGSQILIPNLYADPIIRLITSTLGMSYINSVYRGNRTVINPDYWTNLNMNGC